MIKKVSINSLLAHILFKLVLHVIVGRNFTHCISMSLNPGLSKQMRRFTRFLPTCPLLSIYPSLYVISFIPSFLNVKHNIAIVSFIRTVLHSIVKTDIVNYIETVSNTILPRLQTLDPF